MPIPDARQQCQQPPPDVVMAEADDVKNTRDYWSLKDLRWEINAGAKGLCFWLYLSESTTFPATIIRQVHSDATSALLSLDERKRLILSPMLLVHEELPCSKDTTPDEQTQYTLCETEFPLGRWVHIGYEVSSGFLLLHINGEIVKEKLLSSACSGNSGSGMLKEFILLGADDKSVDGYVCNMEVLCSTFSIKEQYMKEPPLQLSISFSSTSDVDEDEEGIWNIVGGKLAGRRTFTVGVILLDALGRPSIEDLEVAASLLYADDGTPVETPFDAEAPLLTSHDGVEFPNGDKHIKLHNGHATFKLQMSRLSSKCDNRLFRIKFFISTRGAYPSFAAYSPLIRSISKSHKSRSPPDMLKKSSSMVCTSGSESLGVGNGHLVVPQHVVNEAVSSKLAEQNKCFEGKASMTTQRYQLPVRPDEEVHSPIKFNGQVLNAPRTLSKETMGPDEAYPSRSNPESMEAETTQREGMPSSKRNFSDQCVFEYCLGGLDERANILKELALSASYQDFADFGQQVSLYSGCSHHWSQIAMTKKLIGEGTEVWNMISHHNEPVPWENVVSEIQKHFMKIAYTTRLLSAKDLSFLKRVSGCQGNFTHENFVKLWSWLYPVAFTLSRSWVNPLWSSTSPKWIEGFITKEEAERSLRGSRGLEQPGTFILRFPTSRSWPHPDAGNIVVTYVGSDCNLHHKLISLDYIHRSANKNLKSLQDMILNEPELSRLGRVIRS